MLAAAVADYTPQTMAEQKLKKDESGLSVNWARTPDILAHLGQSRGDLKVLVGFAAETERVIENARGKLTRKGADLICANDVSKPEAGFASSDNLITLVTAHDVTDLGMQSKDAAADRILDACLLLLALTYTTMT